MKFKRISVSTFLCLAGLFAEAQNVGVGQLNPISKIDISGNATVGSGYSGVSCAPTNGMNIQGQVVVGNATMVNASDKIECVTTGTTIGFSSLHTGSLANSSAFYGQVTGTGGSGIIIDHSASNDYAGVMNVTSGSAIAGLKGDASANGPSGIFGEYSGSGSGAAVYANGRGLTTATWQVTSDARLKQDIMPIAQGLATVVQLNPVSYFYKPELAVKYNFETRSQLGFLAQDLEKFLPEMVYEAELVSVSEQTREGSTPVEKLQVKTVNYNALIPVLTKAIQEQQILIESLQQNVSNLQAEVKQIKSQQP